MKPDVSSYRSSWPEIDERLIKEHLSRLSDAYFETFREQEIYRHLLSLGRLTPEHPVEVLLGRLGGDRVECTVLAFDYPAEFSLITGVLAGAGVNILTGDVFTYEKPSEVVSGRRIRRRGSAGPSTHEPLRRRRIIDRFIGTLESDLVYAEWDKDLKEKLEQITGLLERGGEPAATEAKQKVQEMVARRLARLRVQSGEILYPMQIEIDNSSSSRSRLKLVSKDTPGFLYALSTSLSLHDILIEHVRIRTVGGNIEDQIDLVDGRGRKIEDPDMLDRLKMSVLITKQFTYFLGRASDPISALSRFEHLLQEIFRQPGNEKSIALLTSPDTLRGLARVLGASDFLWEDFIRLQYETLLPMLHGKSGHRSGRLGDALDQRIREAIETASTFEEQKEGLNAFKDREIYLIDLDHILNPEVDFRIFAERLTRLAEKVVSTATDLVYKHLAQQYGVPTTIGGLEARYAILGLGKLGGAALGYASDIELLFVYGDSGRTDGDASIDNSEFFDRMVKGVIRFIRAKREGIFHVDVRLRPFGNAGPLATSLETFCRYYAKGGQAHSYERLALVRMRAIGGDEALGQRLERLRDEMVYSSDSIDLTQLKELRERQFKEHTGGRRLNAKFSPGGLVDLEYGVQMLQVFHGSASAAIRTPRIHQALNGLSHAEIMSQEEILVLNRAYDFLRRLINGMRMLRGSAKDLFLPPSDSEEFIHLARRMGYEQGGPLGPAEQLRMDFETHTADVRAFAERYFGRDALPGKDAVTVADLVLSEELPFGPAMKLLKSAGFKDPERAFRNLKALAGSGGRRSTFARLALLAFDVLGRVPDPDMALNNWERFMRALGSGEFHYNLLLSQPMRLEILLSILAGSQFLSDTLIRNPVFLDWVTIPQVLHRERTREEMEEDLRSLRQTAGGHREWLNRLRRFRRREILRIGTRDICLRVSPRVVMQELTNLSEAIVTLALEGVLEQRGVKAPEMQSPEADPPSRFCVLAFGKLGGRELNYSSDIDLLGIIDDMDHPDSRTGILQDGQKEFFTHVMESLRADLSTHTEEGYAYRVDLRLRPFGKSGELVPSLSGLIGYYREKASLWEIQALLKIRPIAGNKALGRRFLDAIRPSLLKGRERASVMNSIEKMRSRAIRATRRPGAPVDVKSGAGGLRDVEFMAQGLQLIHAPENPVLLEGNTLAALDLLQEARILDAGLADQLRKDYLFLRRVEHCLQLLDDRQIHSLPREAAEVEALGKRVLGPGDGSERFIAELTDCLARVRNAYNESLIIPQ
jgi:glutamate-ammonia-ligase adenylyltransferase